MDSSSHYTKSLGDPSHHRHEVAKVSNTLESFMQAFHAGLGWGVFQSLLLTLSGLILSANLPFARWTISSLISFPTRSAVLATLLDRVNERM